jgi:hypothetical protein
MYKRTVEKAMQWHKITHEYTPKDRDVRKFRKKHEQACIRVVAK